MINSPVLMVYEVLVFTERNLLEANSTG
jgi:hypothetical protein